jgi:hypothetical protein
MLKWLSEFGNCRQDSPGVVMKRVRLTLPAIQVLFASWLMSVGVTQTRNRLQGGVVWGYLAPAEHILHGVNWPAAALVDLFTSDQHFHLTPYYSSYAYMMYLVAIAALWYCVAVYLTTPSHKTRTVFSFASVAYGCFLLIPSTSVLQASYGYLLVLPAWIWTGVLMLVPFVGRFLPFRRAGGRAL